MGVEKYSYLVMLAFTIVASFWLEFVFKVRVLGRARRVIKSVLPPAFLFLIWDAAAVSKDQWHFDKRQVMGIYGPFHLPLEEYLFFLIIPLAAIMTLEAVRNVKKHWTIGDEK